MTAPISKIDLKINEENELNFKLSIDGTTTDQEMTKPIFRFTITEMNGEPVSESVKSSFGSRGWLFPAAKNDDNIVSVKIPPFPNGFTQNKKYHGKLEVVVGSLYFVPSELIIEFHRPLSVEASHIPTSSVMTERMPAPQVSATPITDKKTTAQLVVSEADKALEEEISSVITSPSLPQQPFKKNDKSLQGTTGTKPTSIPEPKPLKPQAAPQRQQQASPAKTPIAPRQPVPSPNPLINEEKKKELLKKKLLGMMRDALVANDGPGLGNNKVS